MRSFFSFIVVMLLISSICFAQKRLIREAQKFEAAGLHAEAAEKYMQALYQNNTKPESRTGLERNAQKVLDEKLSAYFRARNSENPEAALKAFEEAEYYAKRIDYFNIKLRFPDHYRKDFDDDKQQFLTSLYDEAKMLLNEGQYEKARQNFEKIKAIDPSYKDIDVLSSAADAEPLYTEAVQAYNNNQYTESWQHFSEVEKIDRYYKETQSYKNKIIEKAALTVSVLPAQSSRFKMLDNKFRYNLVAAIDKIRNPFIRIVDRDNLDLIIEEQKLGLTGIIDEKSAARLGKILGVKAILLTQVINYNFTPGKTASVEKIAYEASQYAVRDEVTGAVNYPTKYTPVKYTEYMQRNSLQVSLQYQLVSSETGMLLTSDIIHENLVDVVNYAHYTGNYHNLYPAEGDKIYKSGKERQTFLERFTGRQMPLTGKQLDFNIQPVISDKVALAVNSYLNNTLH